MLKNKVNDILLAISVFMFSLKAFAEPEIAEIEINHEEIPEIMPDLPQVQEVESAAEQGGSFMSQYINEQNLIVAVVVLACIVVALLIVIIYSKFQQPSLKKVENVSKKNIDKKQTGASRDIEGAVKSFLIRTNMMH